MGLMIIACMGLYLALFSYLIIGRKWSPLEGCVTTNTVGLAIACVIVIGTGLTSNGKSSPMQESRPLYFQSGKK